jgi:hypothetical protein
MSVAKLQNLNVKRVYPGHGGPFSLDQIKMIR